MKSGLSDTSGLPGHSKVSSGWFGRSQGLSGRKNPSDCPLTVISDLLICRQGGALDSQSSISGSCFASLNFGLSRSNYTVVKKPPPSLFCFCDFGQSLLWANRSAGIFWETTLCWWQAFPYAISFFLVALGSVWETTWPVHPQMKVGISIHPTFIPECMEDKMKQEDPWKIRELFILVMRVEYLPSLRFRLASFGLFVEELMEKFHQCRKFKVYLWALGPKAVMLGGKN